MAESDAYLFKSANRKDPPHPVPESVLGRALRNRLPIGRGPWHLRERTDRGTDGVSFTEWGPWKTRGSFIRSALGQLRQMKVGTVLEVENRRGKRYRIRAVKLPESAVDKVQSSALSVRGMPYLFAVADPERGFDCSGLTQWCVEVATEGKIVLPHAARLQIDDSRVRRLPLNQAKPWDLLFMWFPNDRGIGQGTPSHVGFYISGDLMYDTRSPSDPVSYSPIEHSNVIAAGRIEAING